MTSTTLPLILKTRLLVAYLGERAQYAWWPTAFYEASSRLFLEPVFSRTSRLAQYHGVLEAARRLHDEHLSVGSYHLFRLPEEVEQDLHNLVLRPGAAEDALQEMRSKDSALGSLRDLAGTVTVKSVGPTSVGSIGDLDSPNTMKAIAAAYLSAFSQDAKTYPYLVA
ncbi:MAG: BrxE family protein [Rhodocyclaceae bacterium]|nr:BrxE family protein [Rhodocyclaceae bacterium]